MGKIILKRSVLPTETLEEKIEGTKKVFEKDKAFIQWTANSNKNNTNEEKNVSNMEGNSSNSNCNDQIYLNEPYTIHTTTIIIASEIEVTVTISQKATIANIIHYAKDNI